MADSLIFDGIDDFIGLTPGNADGMGGFTIAFAVKLVADEAASKNFLGVNTLDSLFGTNNASPHKLVGFFGGGSAAISTFSIPASDGWCIYAYGRDNDSTGNFHKYVFATDTWTHEANGSVILDAVISSLKIGCGGDSLQFVDANLLIGGWWNSNLSDVAIEALEGGYAAWVNSGPAELWRFNSATTLTATVGSSQQTTRTGTSLDPGDAPATWNDNLYNVAWITA